MKALHPQTRTESASPRRLARQKGRSSAQAKPGTIEVLERRELLATFTVTKLNASGAGSLRTAIIQANQLPGADTIAFGVAGTIQVGHSSLPSITGPVTIDGTSAPSFSGAPIVTVDYQGSQGLLFANGADGSVLRSLSLVNASNAGVTLDASHITIQGNYIGLRADGSTVAGNRGDGIKIDPSSHGNQIGNSNAVTGISYYNASSVGVQPVSGWQGIRNGETSGQYLITGTSGANGLLYEGPITGSGGTSFLVNYPNATTTSVYGPDNLGNGVVRLVGVYKTGNDVVNGFVFQGTTADLSQSGHYKTIDYPNAQFTYVHSTMGDLAVGNADGPEGNLPIGTGHAFLYDLASNTFLPDIVYPGSTSTTAYGIWYNGRTSYTIAGGYSKLGVPGGTAGSGYLVDYDSATGKFTHWTSFDYPNGLAGQDFVTHFEGISSTEAGVYTLSADSGQSGSTNPLQGSWVTVRRNPDNSFGPAAWVNLNYPGVTPSAGITSNDSVAGNQVVGIVIASSGVFSFQATVNTGFQLSNVISGNGGNGIGIYGSSDNRIAMNNIGTDVTGTLRRGNAKNGILVTQGAARNLIGGQATGGNNPTGNVFVRPPQGNLISGNGGDGVLINKGATQTLLSGNFVGTTASGNAALGNRLDGVAIENANGNSLIGCTFQQSPFVFYNVLSGNGGNGLRITNSNNTVVQANFMGAGANNATIVPNGNDGLLVSGTSRNTQVGGVIPLGNVISGNRNNGIEVSDKASGFISFNTFAGLFAFSTAAPNGHDGILITSSGGNNLIRTCIVSGNLGNGIELGDNATGVQVTETSAGTNSSIMTALPNQGSGIKISGNAHGNAIGGFQPSLEPQVTTSANRRYGIEIVGHAHDNVVFHTFIGTNFDGRAALGNGLGGIYLGHGTSSTLIGGASSSLQNKILNSTGGPGVLIQSSAHNAVLGSDIEGNAAGGVIVAGGRDNQVGEANAGNTIARNGQNGVYLTGTMPFTHVQDNRILGNLNDGVLLNGARNMAVGGIQLGSGNSILGNNGFGLEAFGLCSGTVVRKNLIQGNAKGNVNVTKSRGITFLP